jgi:hypothetical protein
MSGLTVPDLLAEFVNEERAALDVAELDHGGNAMVTGHPAVPHEQVVRWLRT